MIDRRQQLAWTQRNRAKRVRTREAGEVVGGYASWLMNEAAPVPSWIHDAIRGVTDDGFHGCCRVRGWDQGVVRIDVSEASLVGWMARSWKGWLLEALRRADQGARVSDVRFRWNGEV